MHLDAERALRDAGVSRFDPSSTHTPARALL